MGVVVWCGKPHGWAGHTVLYTIFHTVLIIILYPKLQLLLYLAMARYLSHVNDAILEVTMIDTLSQEYKDWPGRWWSHPTPSRHHSTQSELL